MEIVGLKVEFLILIMVFFSLRYFIMKFSFRKKDKNIFFWDIKEREEYKRRYREMLILRVRNLR